MINLINIKKLFCLKKNGENMKKYFFLFILVIITISCSNKSIKSGSLTIIGSGEDKIKVVVVKGSPYKMGFQLGSILKEDIKKCTDYFINTVKKK